MVVQGIGHRSCNGTSTSLDRILTLLLEVQKEAETSLLPENESSNDPLSELTRLVGVLLELVHILIGSRDDSGILKDESPPSPSISDGCQSGKLGNDNLTSAVVDDATTIDIGNGDERDKKPFVCRLCKKTCRTKFALRSHLKLHRNEYSASDVQDDVVGNDDDVDVIEKEKTDWVVEDEESEEEEEGVSGQISTRKISSSKKQFRCPHCDKKLKSRGCLDSHIKGIHGEKKFQCGQCGAKYGLLTQLNVHVARDHEGRNFPCDYENCSKVYKTKNAMKSHVASFHEGVKHLCALCGKSFSREESLLSHRLYVHEEKGSVCKTCGKEFKRPESMHKHVSRVHRGKTFPCQLCGKALATSKSLRDHVANMHRDDGMVEGNGDGTLRDPSEKDPPTFTCDQCGKVKRTERGLKLHLASVHEGRKFPCKFCGQEFNWHSLRRNHIRTVHEGVKFDCQFCGKNFTQGSALKTHVDTVHRITTAVSVDSKGSAAQQLQDSLIHLEQLTNSL